ncbi:MAG: class I SAM-dependent methyltransferase [Anaerolineae bacterium]
MPGLGEQAVYLLNALTPAFPQNEHLVEVMSDAEGHFAWEYSEGEAMLDEWRPPLDPAGRRMLDVGSGSGGKSLLYSRLGAVEVVGLELDRRLVTRSAARLAALGETESAARRVRIVHGDATRMPLPAAAFDLIVSINALEHIVPPEAALAECARVLRPGGRAYLRFPPYWSAWGPHLERWVHFPWPHLLFSEPTLIRAANRLEERMRLNERMPDFERLDMRGQTEFYHVNRMTMAQFDAALWRLPFRVVGLSMLPTGYKFLPRLADKWGGLGWLPRAGADLLNAAAHSRPGREVIATKAVVVLERTDDGRGCRGAGG